MANKAGGTIPEAIKTGKLKGRPAAPTEVPEIRKVRKEISSETLRSLKSAEEYMAQIMLHSELLEKSSQLLEQVVQINDEKYEGRTLDEDLSDEARNYIQNERQYPSAVDGIRAMVHLMDKLPVKTNNLEGDEKATVKDFSRNLDLMIELLELTSKGKVLSGDPMSVDIRAKCAEMAESLKIRVQLLVGDGGNHMSNVLKEYDAGLATRRNYVTEAAISEYKDAIAAAQHVLSTGESPDGTLIEKMIGRLFLAEVMVANAADKLAENALAPEIRGTKGGRMFQNLLKYAQAADQEGYLKK